MSEKIIEFDLRLPVANWLLSRDLAPVCEVGSLNNCDFAGVRFAEKPRRLVELVAVELKLRDVSGVFSQCLSHRRRKVTEVWAAMPLETARRASSAFKSREYPYTFAEAGVGVLGVNGKLVTVVAPPARFELADLWRWRSAMWRRREEYRWRMLHPRMIRYEAEMMARAARKRLEEFDPFGRPRRRLAAT